MTIFDYSICQDYFDGKLNRAEYFNKIIEFYKKNGDFLIEQLKKEVYKKNPDNLEYLISAIFVLVNNVDNFVIDRYLDIFNHLLLEDWHTKNEDIVILLEKIASYKSLEYLFKGVYFKPSYLEWDDNYSFERKCIYALKKIGGKKAISYLEKIALDDNEIISSCAKRQLKCEN